MYAKVAFIGKTGLCAPYSYSVSDKLANELIPNDYVVVESSKGGYNVGVLTELTDKIEDPSIVTKAVVQRVDVPSYSDPMLDLIQSFER